MTDKAESKVREWASKRNGDPVDVHDAIELALAIDDDASARHDQSVDLIRANHELLITHCEEAEVRDRRIKALEDWQQATTAGCEKRVRKLIEEEHGARHTAYLASIAEGVYQTRLVVFFATTAGKILLVIAGVIAGMLLNLAVYGRP